MLSLYHNDYLSSRKSSLDSNGHVKNKQIKMSVIELTDYDYVTT